MPDVPMYKPLSWLTFVRTIDGVDIYMSAHHASYYAKWGDALHHYAWFNSTKLSSRLRTALTERQQCALLAYAKLERINA